LSYRRYGGSDVGRQAEGRAELERGFRTTANQAAKQFYLNALAQVNCQYFISALTKIQLFFNFVKNLPSAFSAGR